MAASGLHISISAEKLFSIGDLTITNSMFTSLLVSAILISFAVIVNSKLKQTNKPTGLQNFAEAIVEALHNLVHGITGDLQKTRLFLPVISSFFLFILLNNWLGLLPGVGTISIVAEKSEAHASSSTNSNVIQLAAATTETVSDVVEVGHETPTEADHEAPKEKSTTKWC